MPLPDLFTQVRAIGGRLVWRDGVVSVEAQVGFTPEMEASCQAHQAELTLLVPEPKPERWHFYFSQALEADGRNRAWAESYATAQVKREQEQAERMGEEALAKKPMPLPEGLDPARAEALALEEFKAELRAMRPR
jgi:hypothetical protein